MAARLGVCVIMLYFRCIGYIYKKVRRWLPTRRFIRVQWERHCGPQRCTRKAFPVVGFQTWLIPLAGHTRHLREL